jgi:hypothetical protein
VTPDIAPADEISQVFELTAIASPPSPIFVTPLNVAVPLEVIPDVAVISPEIVGVVVHAVGEIVKALPAIVVAYDALPNVVAADIPWKIGEETEVEAERVVTPLTAPAVETSKAVELIAKVFEPPPIETAPVDVPVPILIAKFDDAFRLIAAPEIVAPAVADRRVLNVFAPANV